MEVHWFLPTAGDRHGITTGGQAAATVRTERPPELGYLALVARAAERLGFTGEHYRIEGATTREPPNPVSRRTRSTPSSPRCAR
ncbi:hypothetical protein [Actinoplanes auranticolor]|uniref:Uncharacterized protein n=1 Tax=Actinoplanes auranticolor TaxID=47988 RepID=A0A919S9Y2_9ACTN|nr:hypothetical protein [Actinoplanes auranticolor]GIM67650.1 hypothetical protein Aau02nite_28220 [Actinoplanes auranticolor]